MIIWDANEKISSSDAAPDFFVIIRAMVVCFFKMPNLKGSDVAVTVDGVSLCAGVRMAIGCFE